MIGHLAISLVGGNVCSRTVNRQLQIVRSYAIALRIRIGERSPLQHLVIRKVEAVDENTGSERRLLHLGEVVDGVTIQYHPAHRTKRELILRPDLCVIERIEIER